MQPIVLRMRIRSRIAILILLALGIEVLVDPSTPFVRSEASHNIGELAVMDVRLTKNETPTASSQDDHSQGGAKADSKQQVRFDTPSHAANVVDFKSFDVFFSSSASNRPPIATYSEPPQLIHHRPPIT